MALNDIIVPKENAGGTYDETVLDISVIGGQAQLNGTGFVKASGTTISYDNSTYLTSVPDATTTTKGIASFDSNNFSVTNGSVDLKFVYASNLSSNVIYDQSALTSGLASTDELMISDSNILKKMDVSVLQTYMQDNLTFGAYTEGVGIDIASGVISGEVATTSNLGIARFDGTHFNISTGYVTLKDAGVSASKLNTDVVSGQTELTTGLAGTDELMVSDGGVLKRMDIDVLIAGQAASLITGLAATDELLISDGGSTKKMDVSVLQTYMQNSLTFSSFTQHWSGDTYGITYGSNVGISAASSNSHDLNVGSGGINTTGTIYGDDVYADGLIHAVESIDAGTWVRGTYTRLKQQSSTPTVVSGESILWAGTDGKLYYKKYGGSTITIVA